jgi:hypothetical protein
MRKINAWLFVSLDGVMEAPEKWVMFNDEMGEATEAEYAAADTLSSGSFRAAKPAPQGVRTGCGNVWSQWPRGWGFGSFVTA